MSTNRNSREWLARLVGYDTTSALSNLALIDEVDAFLSGLGARTHRVFNDDETKANLYAVLGPDAEGGVVLSGHTDVVPVAGQNWSTDPFTLTEKEGRLYGRGTCDMKAFSAIALAAAPRMATADLKRPAIFALSYDEEVGCLGAPSMIDEIRARVPTPSAVIVGEPTMMRVIDGHKGIASYGVDVTGYTTHSSQTDRGVSAVETAAKLIAKVVDMRERRAREADPDCPFAPPHTTLSVNVANGGTQLNIMAGACKFDFDMRVVPGETAAEVLEEFADFARGVEAEMRAKAAGCRIQITQYTDVPALAPDPASPAAELAKSLTGDNRADVVSYAAEAGQFQEAGFSTVICGPGSIDQAHQPDEYISLSQLAEGDAFMGKLVDRLCV